MQTSEPLRIALVTTRFWPAVGGVERVAMNLTEAYRSAGHEVTVIAKRTDEKLTGAINEVVREAPRFEPYRWAGASVRQLRLSPARRALLLPLAAELFPLVGRVYPRLLGRHAAAVYAAVVQPRLRSLIADADVVHALGGDLLALAAVEAAHRSGRPAAVTPFAHPGARGFEARAIRAWHAADAVLATTEVDAAGYEEAGVAPQRIQVCGVPVAAPHDAGEALGAPVPDGVPVVLFLGERRPSKGCELLVRSAPTVWTRAPDAHFAFVGPGEALGANDARVLDIGGVSDARRAAWLRRATLVCLPSEWEAFGLAVAEAWSLGVPVVVSDTPVLRELVACSGGGVVSARDPEALAGAIGGLLERPAQARKAGEAGFRYWQRECQPPLVAERHLGVYRALLDRDPRERAVAK